jgi:hypothetical protein
VNRVNRKRGWSLLATALCAMLLFVPNVASAQDGPQFGQWGPGMAPPAPEGVQSDAQSAQGIPSAPAPDFGVPAPSIAPPPTSYGCPYDLRGNWRNQGYMTSGGYGSYSASVHVRQYQDWIVAEQDDGSSYFGRCQGNSLQFDVYFNGQFIGRQSGTIDAAQPAAYTGSDAAPRGVAPSAVAPNVVAPRVGPPTRAHFTWNTYYGAGTENWRRSRY